MFVRWIIYSICGQVNSAYVAPDPFQDWFNNFIAEYNKSKFNVSLLAVKMFSLKSSFKWSTIDIVAGMCSIFHKFVQAVLFQSAKGTRCWDAWHVQLFAKRRLFQFDDDLIRRNPKIHTMYQRPDGHCAQRRPKSAGPRLPGNSNTAELGTCGFLVL